MEIRARFAIRVTLYHQFEGAGGVEGADWCVGSDYWEPFSLWPTYS